MTNEKFAKCDYLNPKLKKDGNKKKVVFLDRDGTIHIDKVNTYRIEDLQYFDDVFTSVKALCDMNYYIVIVTNQDGLKKGLYKTEDMHAFNYKIIDDFRAYGVEIAAVYYSPHIKTENHISFKPNPGMLLQAENDIGIDMLNSFFIGDQMSDVIASCKASVRPILVTTGIYSEDFTKSSAYKEILPPTFKNLTECVSYIKRCL